MGNVVKFDRTLQKGVYMLKPSEREKLQDCLILVQSARNILAGLRQDVLPDILDINKCFASADFAISRLLRT
jgi:hypothetical protein